MASCGKNSLHSACYFFSLPSCWKFNATEKKGEDVFRVLTFFHEEAQISNSGKFFFLLLILFSRFLCTLKKKALRWLSACPPARSTLLVPKEWRFPRSDRGRGGYATAFSALGFVLPESHRNTGHYQLIFFLKNLPPPFSSPQDSNKKRGGPSASCTCPLFRELCFAFLRFVRCPARGPAREWLRFSWGKLKVQIKKNRPHFVY